MLLILACGSVSWASDYPTVSAQTPDPISTTTATLRARVEDDSGGVMGYAFRYKNVGEQEYTVLWGWLPRLIYLHTGDYFSILISGLSPSTSYVFSALAQDRYERRGPWCDELSFTTMSLPPVIQKPTATTQAATGITSTEATLNGTIANDGGELCQYGFRYKEAGGSYSYTTYSGSAGTGQSFSQTVSGLAPVCTYYFAARAKNSAGESDWPVSDQSFTTPPIQKPTVTTQAATAIKSTGATLNGTITYDGDDACKYRFRYKKAGGSYSYTAYTNDLKGTGQRFSYTLSGLDPGSTYYFAAQAKNSVGESDWPASDLTFMTLQGAATVTTQAATDITSNSATLNGTITNDGGSACQYNFRYKKAGGDYKYTWPTGSKRTGEAFSEPVIGLDAGATYYFVAQAWNGCGESESAIDQSFTTSPAQKPAVRTESASDMTDTRAAVRCSITNDGGLDCQYRFRYKKAGGFYTYTSWRGPCREDYGVVGVFLSELSPNTQYIVAAQAKNSAGEGNWGNDVTFATLDVPVIMDLHGTYFTRTKHKYFLSGVPLLEQVTVKIDWKGLEPGTVEWRSWYGRYVDKCTAGQTEVSRWFDVGRDFFGVGDKLGVTAISKGPASTYSHSVTANFTVIPPPPRGQQQYTPVTNEAGEVSYFSEEFIVSLVSKVVNGRDIPLKIPGFGGRDCGPYASVSCKVEVKNGYDVITITEKVNEIKVAGCSFTPHMTFAASDKYKDNNWDGWNDLSLGVSASLSVPLGQWGPFYARGFTDLDTTVHLIGTATDEGDLEWEEAEISLQPDIGLAGGIGVNSVVGAEVYIKGGLRMLLVFPIPQPNPGEGPLEQLCVFLTGGVRGYIWIFSAGYELDPWSWCLLGKWDMQLQSLQLPPDLNSAGFRLMQRDYLGPDYAVWLASATEDVNGPTASITVLGSPQSGSGEEQVLQANVFKLSEPAVAADSGEVWLAWVYDDPGRSIANRTQIVFSRSDGGTWTTPRPIHDDGTAEFSPQLAVLPNGQVLCAWEKVNRVLPDDADLKGMASAMEIAAASYDRATGLWNPQILTGNSYLDRAPRIAAAENNTALVVWVSNEKGDILGQDPNALNTIRYCFWNGSTWGQPGIAATGIGCMLKTTSLAYNGTQAVYVYGVDADWDCETTPTDQELYAVVYNGTGWSQPIRLTNDTVLDANPQVVYDQDVPLLVWYRDGDLVSCRNLDTGHFQQAVQTSGMGSMDFRLAKSPGGHISLVWTDTSAKVKGIDVFTATYDRLSGIWSNVYPLTSDRDTERYLAATYVGPDELALAYDKARIGADDEAFSETGQTDLCVLRHGFARDLAVAAADISVSQANPKPGDTVDITAIVHNLGDVAEANVPVAFYHGNPDEGGVQIGDFQIIPGPIPAAGTGTVSVSWTIPEANSPQRIYVEAFVMDDPQRNEAERNRDDNIAFISVMAPDLTVESVPWEKTGYKVRRITSRIANAGAVPAQNVNVTIHMDSSEGPVLKHFTIPIIDANSVQEVSWDWDITGVDFKDPEIVLYVIVDEDHMITELNEDNNTGMCLVHVSKRGDITDDGSVDGEDLSVLANHWLDTGSSPNWLPACDLDHNGRIDSADFAILAHNWRWEAVWHTE